MDRGAHETDRQKETIDRRRSRYGGWALPPAEVQSEPTRIAGPFTVRDDEGRPGGLWFVHGEKTFFTKVSGADVNKRYAIIEAHTPPGLGPELHIHPMQNELFFVLKDSIGV